MVERKEVKISKSDAKELVEKYYVGAELVPHELYSKDTKVREELKSIEYKVFKEKNPTFLTRLIVFGSSTIGKVIQFSINKEEEKKTNTLLYLLGFDFDAKQLYGFSVFVLVAGFLLGILLMLLGLILPGLLIIILGVVGFFLVQYFPKQQMEIRLSKSSSDLVTFILYLIIYMRQTPNLEAAVQFASDNLNTYLAFDLKKLIWDTAARKYVNIKEALDAYAQRWAKTSPAFTDALFLVESSVLQEIEENRLALLDEASQRILSGTFESMTEYASTLKEPLNTVYMLGMVLPVLGLVLAPMMMAFVAVPDFGLLLALMYDIALPLMVYFLIHQKLVQRPAGFAAPDLSMVPGLPKIGSFYLKVGGAKIHINAIIPAALVFGFFLFLVYLLLPYMFIFGPMQIYVSMLITAGIGFAFFVYFKLSVFQLEETEDELIRIQNSFSSALFQMGSFLAQGFPPETTIIKVKETMKNTPLADFFNVTVNNIKNLGMSLNEAFFNKAYGSLKFFPSPMLMAGIRVFIEAAKKSVGNASAATLYVSKHLSNLRRIDGQVKSLLEEVTSGMRVEVGLLSPVMAGIVVGLTTLIGTVLRSLSGSINTVQNSVVGSAGTGSSISSVVPFAFSLFNLSGGQIPLYTFQIIIGIYLITLSIIIGYAISNISQPGDRIVLRKNIASILLTSMAIYLVIAFIVTLVFGSIGGLVLGATHLV
ncbi:MAG: hypothetical protein M1348_00100 [Candidatus Parvarchaeota archaeon]|nr:hypothetical protein [Candidatus Parvarchaeota archaeon]MCL5101001.1 hypothetical protein [Candidatus Parvarchaeota archaeon]